MRIHKKRTPDFKIFKDASLIAYCECKEIEEDKREYTEKNGHCLDDNTYNKVSNIIENSTEQFDNVNENHDIPNILFIFNNRQEADSKDFVFTYTGNLYGNDGKTIPALKKVSEGKIKKRKEVIDLCLWQNKKDQKPNLIFNTDSPFYGSLCKYFDKDQKKIKVYNY